MSAAAMMIGQSGRNRVQNHILGFFTQIAIEGNHLAIGLRTQVHATVHQVFHLQATGAGVIGGVGKFTVIGARIAETEQEVRLVDLCDVRLVALAVDGAVQSNAVGHRLRVGHIIHIDAAPVVGIGVVHEDVVLLITTHIGQGRRDGLRSGRLAIGHGAIHAQHLALERTALDGAQVARSDTAACVVGERLGNLALAGPGATIVVADIIIVVGGL